MHAPQAPVLPVDGPADVDPLELTRGLHSARHRLASAQGDVDVVEAAIEEYADAQRARWEDVYEELEAARLSLEKAEEAVKAEALRRYATDRDKKGVPGVSIRVHKNWEITDADADAFAERTGLFQKVDRAAVRKFAKDQFPGGLLKNLGETGEAVAEVEGMRVTVRADPRPAVSSDLSDVVPS